MTTRFVSRSGLTVERREIALDYAKGIGNLVDRLDTERGVYLSSGSNFPTAIHASILAWSNRRSNSSPPAAPSG